jgi:hypothetical protein
MIKVPFPHMVLNAEGTGLAGTAYKMWNTYEVPHGESPEHILSWAAEVARTSPWRYLETVIFNSHGCGPRLLIGSEITRNDTPKFEVLKGLVNRIWLVACSAARIGEGREGDGNLFCCEIAKASGAFVMASTANQKGEKGVKYGYIDDWEGTVLTYGPEGNVVATKTW